MKYLLIITSLLLFLGCQDDKKSNGTKISASSNTNKTFINNTDNDNNSFIATSNSINTDIEFIKTIGINGIALDISLSDDGDFAYVASGDYGLQILDISDPIYPELIGTYDTYGYVNHVEVIGNIAFVSYVAQTWENYERLNAYDITYPEDAQYLGYYEGYKSNNHQLIETDNKFYHLFNKSLFVTSKEDTRYQSSYALYDPYAIALHKGYVFVANGMDGITILKTRYEKVSTLKRSFSLLPI